MEGYLSINAGLELKGITQWIWFWGSLCPLCICVSWLCELIRGGVTWQYCWSFPFSGSLTETNILHTSAYYTCHPDCVRVGHLKCKGIRAPLNMLRSYEPGDIFRVTQYGGAACQHHFLLHFRLMLMSLYNVSINLKGLKYISESPGFIPLLWWLLSGKDGLYLCVSLYTCSPVAGGDRKVLEMRVVHPKVFSCLPKKRFQIIENSLVCCYF